MQDHLKWVPMLDEGGGGAPDDNGLEDDDHLLEGGEWLLINDEDNQAGQGMGVDNHRMGHTTTIASASTSFAMMASGRWGDALVVAFTVNSNCIVTYFTCVTSSNFYL